MFSTLKFLFALFKTNLKSATALRGYFLLSMTFMALNNAAFFVFWWVLMARVQSLRGWQLSDIELVFGISAGGFGLMQAVCGGAMHLSRFVEDGTLEPLLPQPKPTLPYALGCRSQASGFGDMLSGLGFIAHAGYLTGERAPFLLLALVASALTFTATCVTLFSLAFWVPRTQAFSRQLLDVVITFSLYPEPIFGGLLKLVLFTLLPAGFVSYLPASVVKDPSWLGVTGLVCAAAGYVWLACRIFRAGLARYSSGSRFGVFG